jgi:hypothetical protein
MTGKFSKPAWVKDRGLLLLWKLLGSHSSDHAIILYFLFSVVDSSRLVCQED